MCQISFGLLIAAVAYITWFYANAYILYRSKTMTIVEMADCGWAGLQPTSPFKAHMLQNWKCIPVHCSEQLTFLWIAYVGRIYELVNRITRWDSLRWMEILHTERPAFQPFTPLFCNGGDKGDVHHDGLRVSLPKKLRTCCIWEGYVGKSVGMSDGRWNLRGRSLSRMNYRKLLILEGKEWYVSPSIST